MRKKEEAEGKKEEEEARGRRNEEERKTKNEEAEGKRSRQKKEGRRKNDGGRKKEEEGRRTKKRTKERGRRMKEKVRKTQTKLECQRCFTESTSIAASELDERNPKSPGKRFNTPSKLSNQSTNTNCPPHIDLKTAQVERARAANEIKFLQLTHKCTLNASSAPRRKETRR